MLIGRHYPLALSTPSQALMSYIEHTPSEFIRFQNREFRGHHGQSIQQPFTYPQSPL